MKQTLGRFNNAVRRATDDRDHSRRLARRFNEAHGGIDDRRANPTLAVDTIREAGHEDVRLARRRYGDKIDPNPVYTSTRGAPAVAPTSKTKSPETRLPFYDNRGVPGTATPAEVFRENISDRTMAAFGSTKVEDKAPVQTRKLRPAATVSDITRVAALARAR